MIQINVRAVAFFETIMILPLLVEDDLLRSAEFVSQIKMLLVFCVGISYLILTGSKGSVFCCDPGSVLIRSGKVPDNLPSGVFFA